MYQKILVGTDGSRTADKAVGQAVDLASTLGAELVILSAGPAAKAAKVVEEAAAFYADRGVSISTLTSTKEPVVALLEAARESGADALVMGNKGMTGITRIFGSVTNRVAHQQLPCSLLVVKTT